MSEPEPSTHLPEDSPTSEGSPAAEPESPTYSIAEPIPQWDHATATWQWGWELHWIGLGSLFTLLALYALWSTISMARVKQKRKRRLSIFVSSMLLVFGTSRALFLFINPYESPQCYILPHCPVLLIRVLFGIGLPCLTAAFSFIQLVFLRIIKMRLYPGRVQSWKFLLGIIFVHFSLALFTEVIVYVFADWKALSIVCQTFFIVFSLVLSVTFIYTGHRIIQHVHKSARHVSRMGHRNDTNVVRHATGPSRQYTPNVGKLVKITYMTAALGLASCALQLYSIFEVYNMYRDEYVEPEPWPWWVFQTLFRIVELIAGCTMAYVSPRQTKHAVFALPLFLCCYKRTSQEAVFYNTDFRSSDRNLRKNSIDAGKQNVLEKVPLETKLSRVELIQRNGKELVTLSARPLTNSSGNSL